MDALTALSSRRSVRRFREQPVPDALVQQILQAAMQAPSAGNEQPWQFVIVDDRNLLQRIPDFHPYAQMTRESPIAIVVCADLQLQKFDGFWVQDCAAATQNILLAAHALGLGAVWTALYHHQERVDGMRNLLAIPQSIVPFSLVPIGYPLAESKTVHRFDAQRIHKNCW